MAELVGRERPDEVIVLGGHIDSWDVGQGAMDDGGGSVAAWEAVRLMKELGLRPRRTVRVVLNVDGTRYFWYHHTNADTLDKLDPREVGLCVATMAVMAYVVAEMPDRLPR